MTSSNSAPVFPSLPRRFLAGLIDSMVMIGFVPVVLGCMAMSSSVRDPRVLEPSPTMVLLQWGGFILALMWIYTVAMECSDKQATLGKQALKIKVVNDQGAPLTPTQSTWRFVSFLGTVSLAGLPMLGCLAGRGQSYFERWNKTLVVHNDATVADMRHKQQIYTAKGWWGTMALVVLFASIVVNTAGPALEEMDTAYRMHRTQIRTDAIVDAIRSHQATTGEWPAHLRDVDRNWDSDTLDAGDDADVRYTPGKITYAWRFDSMEGQKTEVKLYPGLIFCPSTESDLVAESPSTCGIGRGG